MAFYDRVLKEIGAHAGTVNRSMAGESLARDVVLPMAAVLETRLHIVVGYTPQLE